MSTASSSDGLPSHAMLDAPADEAFDRLAATVRAVLDVPVALVSLVDSTGQVFPGQSGLPAPMDETRRTPLTHSFCQHVVRTGEGLVVPDARHDERLRTNLAISDFGFIAYAGVPLLDLNGSVVGSLCAIDYEPRDWSDADITLLEHLGAACSAELQLRTAAVRATEAQRHTTALLALAESLSNSATLGQVTAAVERFTRERLGAVLAWIAEVDPQVEAQTSSDRVGTGNGAHEGSHRALLFTNTPSATVASTGRPLFHSNLEDLGADYPEVAASLGAAGGDAYACVPLRVNFRLIGTLGVAWAEPHTVEPDEEALLCGLSRFAAQAVWRAQLLKERGDTADVLQAAMMPSLHNPDNVNVAACYLPARSANSVGGDWYDTFELADGGIIATVGDVEGHDVEASAIMGRIRSSLASLAIALPGSPSDVLTALDKVLDAQPVGRYATGLLACVDRDQHTVTWSNAGHPPPLLLVPGRPATYLERTAERPLGLRVGQPRRTTHQVGFPPGSTLLMYTDGLLDRRYDNADETDQLVHSVERHRGLLPAELIDAVIGDWLDTTQHNDDVVLVAIQTCGL